jgi:hypothetical protein
MSYEDLKEARVKRAAKEEATAGRGKRGRKRKSAAPEAGAPEPKVKVARMIEPPEPWKAPVARMSEAHVAEDEIGARGMENHCSVLQLGSV